MILTFALYQRASSTMKEATEVCADIKTAWMRLTSDRRAVIAEEQSLDGAARRELDVRALGQHLLPQHRLKLVPRRADTHALRRRRVQRRPGKDLTTLHLNCAYAMA